MAFMDFLFGKEEKTKTKPIYNPQQEQLLNTALGGLQQQLPLGLQNLRNILGGDEETFESFFAPARRNFEQKTLPSIAERFTGMLGEGSQRSSAFGQQLGEAGKSLEEDIFSQRIGMQQDALMQLLQLMSPALAQREYEYTTPRQAGFLENLGVGAAQGLGGFLGGGIPGLVSGGLKGLSGLFSKGNSPSSFQSSAGRLGYNPANFGTGRSAY